MFSGDHFNKFDELGGIPFSSEMRTACFLLANSLMSTAKSSCSNISCPMILSIMSSIARTPTTEPNSSTTILNWQCSESKSLKALSAVVFSGTKTASLANSCSFLFSFFSTTALYKSLRLIIPEIVSIVS